MYRIENKSAAIKEVQRLLGINRTGIYDQPTMRAVKNIQSDRSFPVTGKVDYRTFMIIAADYRKGLSHIWNNAYLFSPSFPYLRGSQGENVSRINEALAIILEDYFYEEDLPYGAYYGETTERGVQYLRGIFGLQGVDGIDEVLMNRIMLERDAIEDKRRHSL